MFYTYRQNNTHGRWQGPAMNVIIEADSGTEADFIAQSYIYFDGVNAGIDCPCCGDRWHRRFLWFGGDTIPMIDGEPAQDYGATFPTRTRVYMIVYKDGRIEPFDFTRSGLVLHLPEGETA